MFIHLTIHFVLAGIFFLLHHLQYKKLSVRILCVWTCRNGLVLSIMQEYFDLSGLTPVFKLISQFWVTLAMWVCDGHSHMLPKPGFPVLIDFPLTAPSGFFTSSLPTSSSHVAWTPGLSCVGIRTVVLQFAWEPCGFYIIYFFDSRKS